MIARKQDRWWVWAQNALSLAVLALSPLTGSGPSSIAQLAAGTILILLGAAAGITGVRALGQNRTPHPEPRADGRLVLEGVYAIVRHPLYASLILLAGGWALIWRSWIGAILAAALTLLLDRKARREEQYLRERFPEYPAYARRVRRFLPGFY
jgi:protein-S-isoprenylcysteine O-methyltransferase Ste14